jgi:four helix bundle protein
MSFKHEELKRRTKAVCRARSKAEFISKIGIVVEEADETVFWLEMLVETNIVSAKKMDELLKEANELLAIFAASQRTAKKTMNQ